MARNKASRFEVSKIFSQNLLGGRRNPSSKLTKTDRSFPHHAEDLYPPFSLRPSIANAAAQEYSVCSSRIGSPKDRKYSITEARPNSAAEHVVRAESIRNLVHNCDFYLDLHRKNVLMRRGYGPIVLAAYSTTSFRISPDFPVVYNF